MRLLPSLRSISATGVIVIMLTIMIIFGGLGFLFLSSLSIDQNNFQIAFNQSITEHRQQTRADQAFRNLALQDIERSQNNTREFLPLLTQSFADIKTVVNTTDDLENTTQEMRNLIAFLRANFNETMLAETYKEYAATHEMNDKLDILLEERNR